jgi:hypothetical protein
MADARALHVRLMSDLQNAHRTARAREEEQYRFFCQDWRS